MAKEVFEWNNVIEGAVVNTGDNSQIRTAVIERSDKKVVGVVTIRKWARYVKKEERELGVTLDEMDYRPTKDGLSLPIQSLPALIEELQGIYDDAVAEGLIEVEKKATKKLVAKSAR